MPTLIPPLLLGVGAVGPHPVHGRRRHPAERRFGVVGVELVEVHEARGSAGGVLVGRDHGEVVRGRGRDVADVHEVGPVPQRLRLVRGSRADEHQLETERGPVADRALTGAAVVPEVQAAHIVGHVVGRGEPGVGLVHAQGVELGDRAGEVGAERHAVAPPGGPGHPRPGQNAGDPLVGVAGGVAVGELEVQAGRDAVLHVDPLAQARGAGRC